MEIKYPENIALECCPDIIVRPYILFEQQKVIIESLLNINNHLDREYALDCALLNVCTDLDGEFDYDGLKAMGVFEELRMILSSYVFDIDETIREVYSVPNIVKSFLDDITDIADKAVKKMPTQKAWEKTISALSDKFSNIKTDDIVKAVKKNG